MTSSANWASDLDDFRAGVMVEHLDSHVESDRFGIFRSAIGRDNLPRKFVGLAWPQLDVIKIKSSLRRVVFFVPQQHKTLLHIQTFDPDRMVCTVADRQYKFSVRPNFFDQHFAPRKLCFSSGLALSVFVDPRPKQSEHRDKKCDTGRNLRTPIERRRRHSSRRHRLRNCRTSAQQTYSNDVQPAHPSFQSITLPTSRQLRIDTSARSGALAGKNLDFVVQSHVAEQLSIFQRPSGCGEES